MPNAFTDGEIGCVGSTAPQSASQVTGATCYPGANTSGSTVGICCLFKSCECACSAGLHTCDATGTQVDSCSAASLPATPPGCGSGLTQVAGCL